MNYRVLEQVDKVNDSLFEAKSQGLSSSPVIDRFGNFLRYEILISPATYDYILANTYYTQVGQTANGQTVNMSCAMTGTAAPTDADSGSMTIKLAWMVDPADGTNPPDTAYDTSNYWNQEFLVYDPPQVLGQTGGEDTPATCTLKNFLLVGMHIARKTLSQQGWIWSTFEHHLNAPPCTEALSTGVNKSCPMPGSTSYNLSPGNDVCTGMADGTGPCQACNTPPAKNCTTSTSNPTLLQPNSTNTSDYCINAPPFNTAGYSQLCRQAGPDNPYPDATTANSDCHAQDQVAQTRWQNYELISTQWSTLSSPDLCGNQASTYNNFNKVEKGFLAKANVQPQVNDVPFLANTSMESYERSNCLGCHSKAVGSGQPATGLSSDFVYHLQFEVFQQPQ